MNLNYLREHKDGIFVFILYSFYAVGILGHLVNRTFPLMMILTPFVLLVFGLAVLLRTTAVDRKLLLWCFLAYIFTFTVEALGVHSGAIFGEYHYGSTLGLKLLRVPLVIGFNWVLVVLGAITLARKISNHIIYSALLAALFTALFDIPLEIVAINLDYWHWAQGTVPFQNYFAWFIVAFIVALSFNYFRLKPKGNIVIHYFFIQLIFFILIDVMIYANLL
jgi:putative membrane protein